MIKFYRRYQSIKKLNTNETEGINIGTSFVFSKIDGTNAQVWYDGEQIQAGSRNRQLDETSQGDNAGFCKYIRQDERFKRLFEEYPNLRLYGEWLCPHSLRTYRDDAWRKFYVFDVILEYNTEKETDNFKYLHYELYKTILDKFDIEYITPLGVIHNATIDNYLHYLSNNKFLIKDGQGDGEGIVIKNYNYKNKFGRVVWAKVVTNEFKEKHHKTMGSPVISNDLIEEKIANEFLTEALIDKEYSKIVHEKDCWDNKYIGKLLNTCYYCLITEELWNVLRKYRGVKIDFSLLNRFSIERVKKVKSELFI